MVITGKKHWMRILVLFGLFLTLLSGGSSAALARDDFAYLREIRRLETGDLGLVHPAGLAFSPDANVFVVIEAQTTQHTNLVEITPYGDLARTVHVDIPLSGPANVAFDSRFNRLLFLEADSNELVGIQAGPDGHLVPSTEAFPRFKARQLGLKQPRAMTADPATGELFLLDRSARQIVRIAPGADGVLDSAQARDAGRVSTISLKRAGVVAPRDLAFNPGNGHLYLLSPARQEVYELTQRGQTVATFDLSPLGFVDPRGLAFAPSTDPTDDPSIIHMYVADTGPGVGRIVEMSFNPPPSTISSAPTIQATLERITLMSQYSPPSPDPAGLAYLPSSGSLLISDSEVNEMPQYFTGDNLFETSLAGDLLDTLTTVSFSEEPTGVAYDPVSQHLFFSDDNARRVFEMDPGPDGLYDTADDIITWFNTGDFGSEDPEGIAFDNWQGHLFISDGAAGEVYDVDPGSNGIFDGVPPAGDDVVTHFDTTALGLEDPEGVEFDPEDGHLYVLGDNEIIAETTPDGTVIRYIGLAAVHPRKGAGLAYAPSSTNPAQMNLYIVDRGVDNNSDPDENDGKMYEISFNQWPTADAGLFQVVALSDSALLDGTVADDGLPDPPGAVTTNWSQVSGPGATTFADPSAVDTSATFSQAGIYLLRLTADDGELSAGDEVTIVAYEPEVEVTTLEARALFSTDDAEEQPSGEVSLSSVDLQLVHDVDDQEIGVRFSSLDIPQGAAIDHAYLQFTAAEVNSEPTTLIIEGQDVDDAPTFSSTSYDISSRARTTASVPWSPQPWTTAGDAGPDQRTPDVAAIIQEIVDRPGWSSGSSLVFIFTGTGKRVALSYDGDENAAPLLLVEYSIELPPPARQP